MDGRGTNIKEREKLSGEMRILVVSKDLLAFGGKYKVRFRNK
tara:strand:- start:310 stop:435 length:126 start_codon:yes stop_codon:yes gene_type:complete